MDMGHLAIDCMHPLPTLPLLRVGGWAPTTAHGMAPYIQYLLHTTSDTTGAYYSLWQSSSHPLPKG